MTGGTPSFLTLSGPLQVLSGVRGCAHREHEQARPWSQTDSSARREATKGRLRKRDLGVTLSTLGGVQGSTSSHRKTARFLGDIYSAQDLDKISSFYWLLIILSIIIMLNTLMCRSLLSAQAKLRPLLGA